MGKFMKTQVVSLLIILSGSLIGCQAAEYGFKGPVDQTSVILGNPELPDEPPIIPPVPVPPCKKKVWIDVKDLDAVLSQSGASPGAQTIKNTCHAKTPDKIDLCALSKDFIGTITKVLGASWTADDYFTSLSLILNMQSNRGRVESATGAFICNLTIPAGLMGKIAFKSAKAIKVSTSKKVTFPFDENQAVKKTSSTSCELVIPAGGYSLYE